MTNHLQELDHRCHDGLDVRLLWSERDDKVIVAVTDYKTGAQFELEVREGERPLEVFHHPYAFAAWHGIRTEFDELEVLSWAA